MTKTKRSRYLEELFNSLEKDWKGLYRKYPDQAIFALGDARVTTAIEKRFEQNAPIKDIRSLQYDFLTGLNNLCFEFAPTTTSIGVPFSDAFLVTMDGNCKVVNIIDPFDPAQPNSFVPPLPKEGEQPFVLSRPSVAGDLTFAEQELYPVQVRSSEFFRRLTAGGSGPAVDLIKIYGTRCNYTTRTPSDYWTDNAVDDCGTPPILA